MKEAAKILSLLVLLLALAAAPWLLLQQQSAMVDNTVHREAVALDGPEAIDGGSFSVMDRLTLISQSVYDTGSYVVTPLDNSSPSVTLRLDLILEQLYYLQDTRALPQLDLADNPPMKVHSAQQVEFYDSADTSRYVRLLLVVMSLDARYKATIVMDMENDLLYTVTVLDDLMQMVPEVLPDAYLTYLTLPVDAAENQLSMTETGVFSGSITLDGEPPLAILAFCTSQYASYTLAALEASGLMPF